MQPETSQIWRSEGFGILEVVIAAGLLSVLSLGLMTMIIDSLKAQRGARASDVMRDFTVEVRSVLSNSTACLNSFSGANLSGGSATITTIKDQSNSNKYVSGLEYLGGLLKFDKVVLKDFVADVATPNIGKAKLFLYSNKTGSVIGAQATHHILSVQVEMDGAQNIIKCIAIGGLNDSLWQVSSSSTNDIYFHGGNVGIGTTVPSMSLEVVGDIRSSGNFLGPQHSQFGLFTDSNYASGASIQLSGTTGTTPNTLTFQTGAALSPRMIVDATGNVGIGTTTPNIPLDVVGDIRSSGNFLGPQHSQFGLFTDSSYASGAAIQLSGTGGTTPNTLTFQTGAALSPRVIVNAAGNVGIGTIAPSVKLDVAGEAKISSSGAACSSTNEGSLRYNSGTKKMQFCNGTAWLNIGGSAPVCRVVNNYGSAPTYWSDAQCDSDEYVMGGGGSCSTPITSPPLFPTTLPQFGFLHSSGLNGNGWQADCFLNDGSGDAPSLAWALCCKNQ